MRAYPMTKQLPRHVIADGQPVELLERAEIGILYSDHSKTLSAGMYVAVDENAQLILVATGYIYLNAGDRTFRRVRRSYGRRATHR